jgi:isopentenyl diphosphate isomerase/L-lactate dehydrogenase-like FMN-dependent dehydrogenase
MIGTPLVVALAAAGARGVHDFMVGLERELRRNMSITGCASPHGIDPGILHFM